MESFKIQNLSFTYPERERAALSGINLSVLKGEFVCICGRSGCGKTTLVRLLKPSVSPFGNTSGEIFFEGKPLNELGARDMAAKMGFVMQNPDNQIVTDKVWHELAFGLESLGMKTPEIRTRVSEMAAFFGIENLFYKNTDELSGGQKQLLNLASVMAMQPSAVILDEPTSQLDPIAAQEFLSALGKINRELGTTVILTEHRLEEAFSMADRIVVMDEGKITADGTPREAGRILCEKGHEMCRALPTPVRIHGAVKNDLECPLTVREGREWLSKLSFEQEINADAVPEAQSTPRGDAVIELCGVYFRYGRELPDVIRGLDLKVCGGEIFAILGGNGAGKTTALSLISGLRTPYRGEVLIKGEKISKIKNLYGGLLGVLPQNPQSLFTKKSVYLDLADMLPGMSGQEAEERILKTAALCRIEDVLNSHPFDLSGGEQQRAALAKVLLLCPEILLLDEPTKGMDAAFKEEFADILDKLKADGKTIVMVSHDIEFCAEYADRCALFFDGAVTSEGVPREFFAGNSFYTTSANRMAREILPKAVLAEDVISACGGNVKKREKRPPRREVPKEKNGQKPKKKKPSAKRMVWGSVLALLFFATAFAGLFYGWGDSNIFKTVQVLECALCLGVFFSGGDAVAVAVIGNRGFSKRTLAAAVIILFAIPLTIYTGIKFLGDRKYYFISLLIILEILIPFAMVFESRRPQARELIIISVLCAVAVAGRAAFFMVPQFKPVAAVVIIAGIVFGGETGFLVGAMTGFVSNFFFGQGPWAPWQMFAFGIIGFISGVVFGRRLLPKNKTLLCIYGFAVTFFVYGGIINPASVIMWQTPTAEKITAAYAAAVPFDLIHAFSTAFFLWFISEPMIEKLYRVKMKYGLL